MTRTEPARPSRGAVPVAPATGGDGAAQLRHERSARGYSQQQLATAARVSVRTVRGLESGSVDRPRSDTLTRISETLGLYGDARSRFLAGWGIVEDRHVVPPEDMVSAPEQHRRLLDEVRRRLNDLGVAFVHNANTIDARGNMVRQEAIRLGVAKVDGLRGSSIVWIADTPQMMRGSRFTDLHGCTVGREIRLDECTQIVDIDFGRSLAKDETHYFRYARTIPPDPDGPPAPTPDNPWNGRQTEVGMHDGTRVCVVEVQFAAARKPVRCVYLLRRRLGGTYEQVRDLPIDASGLVQLSLVEPTAGWHGIGWIW